ncbi:hypothetical protein KIN20_024856 [Parelaphostrongylus tenuis]|uniref:Uncharacterized protein n=1 Tax=Parelaphostrongylus tenuis TaxID=148309 RepID=A0AAD5ND11_PARTN|nr:hypothetical protein KIN20_024856 [Parelaphostrongylus tenuis]
MSDSDDLQVCQAVCSWSVVKKTTMKNGITKRDYAQDAADSSEGSDSDIKYNKPTITDAVGAVDVWSAIVMSPNILHFKELGVGVRCRAILQQAS